METINANHLLPDFTIPPNSWYLFPHTIPLAQPPPLQFPPKCDFLPLNPPADVAGHPATLIHPYLPPAEFPTAGLQANQVSCSSPSPEPPVSAPQAPGQWPTLEQIKNFHFCPFTEGDRVCGFTYWKKSPHKAIKRHMKRNHFVPGSNTTAWRCPNPMCRRKSFKITRKDGMLVHRRQCDKKHRALDPRFVPSKSIEEGDDGDVERWIKAGRKTRTSIKKWLKEGIPWSLDLLEPIRLPVY